MKSAVILLTALLCMSSIHAVVVPISFERVTSNSGRDIAGQFTMNVSDNAPVWDSSLGQYVNKVTFMFMNKGPVNSSITEIYFYDGVLLNMYSIDDSCPGVQFENLGEATSPAELPGFDQTYPLVVVLSATEAVNPAPQKGVNASEWVKVGYTLKPGKSFEDVLDNLASHHIVVGIHVSAIGTASTSDAFISVPEPATLMLLGVGAASLMFGRKQTI